MNALMNYVSWRRERQRQHAEDFANSKRGQKMMNSKRMQKYAEKRKQQLEEGIEERRKEEQDTTQGEPVWFSRFVSSGRLRHWVLITHNRKFELRRNTINNDEQPTTSDDKAMFTYNIQDFDIDQEKREAALADCQMPHLNGYYVCLIGWTRKSRDDIEAICKDLIVSFGTYSLLWNNCQDFLRAFADRILTDKKAIDYPWFATNTRTRYQKEQHLLPPPAEMMLRSLQRAQASMMNQNMILQQNLNNQMIQQSINQMMMQQVTMNNMAMMGGGGT